MVDVKLKVESEAIFGREFIFTSSRKVSRSSLLMTELLPSALNDAEGVFTFDPRLHLCFATSTQSFL